MWGSLAAVALIGLGWAYLWLVQFGWTKRAELFQKQQQEARAAQRERDRLRSEYFERTGQVDPGAEWTDPGHDGHQTAPERAPGQVG